MKMQIRENRNFLIGQRALSRTNFEAACMPSVKTNCKRTSRQTYKSAVENVFQHGA